MLLSSPARSSLVACRERICLCCRSVLRGQVKRSLGTSPRQLSASSDSKGNRDQPGWVGLEDIVIPQPPASRGGQFSHDPGSAHDPRLSNAHPYNGWNGLEQASNTRPFARSSVPGGAPALPGNGWNGMPAPHAAQAHFEQTQSHLAQAHAHPAHAQSHRRPPDSYVPPTPMPELIANIELFLKDLPDLVQGRKALQSQSYFGRLPVVTNNLVNTTAAVCNFVENSPIAQLDPDKVDMFELPNLPWDHFFFFNPGTKKKNHPQDLRREKQCSIL